MLKRKHFLRAALRLGPAVALALAASSLAPSVADETGQAIESTRDTIGKWVETQQILSREREEWRVGKDVLEQRINLVSGEIRSLEQRMHETQGSIDTADDRRREMAERSQALKAATGSLEAGIGALETKALALVATLPDPIKDRVRPLTQRIPTSGDEKRSLGERFQNVVGILNEVNKFNREIVFTSEVRELPGGAAAEVQALYVGLGQGYYVTPSGDAAGIGRPTPEGWTWESANELAPQIARAIAILKAEDVPGYVPLPGEIR